MAKKKLSEALLAIHTTFVEPSPLSALSRDHDFRSSLSFGRTELSYTFRIGVLGLETHLHVRTVRAEGSSLKKPLMRGDVQISYASTHLRPGEAMAFLAVLNQAAAMAAMIQSWMDNEGPFELDEAP